MSNIVFNLDSLDIQNEIIRRLKNAGGGSTPQIEYGRYTVKIDKNNSSPSNRITYMHDAIGKTPAYMDYTNGVFNYGDWGDVWFIKENYPVMLKYDGTVDYKLNPNDYTKKEDGSASDIANLSYNGNAMSRFPKVYLSFTEDTNYEYISVCESKYDETYEPIGFVNDSGNEVDEIFLSIYEGSMDGVKLRSISGQSTYYNVRFSDYIAYAKVNGTGWYTRTWAQRQMVNALLTIISKSDDSQTAFGMGNINGSSVITSGSLNDKGQFYGYNDRTHRVKVFHIEDWWGNCNELLAGLIVASTYSFGYKSSTLLIKMNGYYTNPSSVKTSGYTSIITYSADAGSESTYGANCKCDNICGRLPIRNISPAGTSGSSSTFLCDGFYIRAFNGPAYSTVYYFPQVGGSFNNYLKCGALSLSAKISNEANSDTAASLSYISQS